MINSSNIVGRLTKDPEMRYSQQGKAIANYTVAVNRSFKNANGEREADFINCVQFGKGAELTAEYMKKGSQLGITGRIQTRTYENKEGKTVFVTEVVAENVAFLDSKSGGNKQQPKQDNAFKNEGTPVDIEGELPF